MAKQDNFLTYEDLEIGKKVTSHQLTKITGTMIILKDLKPSTTPLGCYTTEGTIQDFYKDKRDAKAETLEEPYMTIYNPPHPLIRSVIF